MTTDWQYDDLFAISAISSNPAHHSVGHSDGAVTSRRGEILEAQMGISAAAADYTVGAFQRGVIDWRGGTKTGPSVPHPCRLVRYGRQGFETAMYRAHCPAYRVSSDEASQAADVIYEFSPMNAYIRSHFSLILIQRLLSHGVSSRLSDLDSACFSTTVHW